MNLIKIIFLLSIFVLVVIIILIFKSSNKDNISTIKRTSLEQIHILTLNPILDAEVSHMEALINGRLLVKEKCLKLVSKNSNNIYTLIWPSYFSIQIERENLVVKRDQKVVVREGNFIQLSGGEITDISDVDINNHNHCSTKPPYWLVGEEVKKMQ